MNSVEVTERLAGDTVEPRMISLEETARHVAAEITRFRTVAQRAGVRID